MGHLSASVLRQVIDNASVAPQDGDPSKTPAQVSPEVKGDAAPNAPGTPKNLNLVKMSTAGTNVITAAAPVPSSEAVSTAAHAGHMRMLFDNAPVAMAMFDTKMGYILANRRWLEDFKLQSVEVTGRSQYELFPSLHPGWRHVYERALNGQVVRSDRDAITQDGRPVVYRWEVRPWRNADTTIGGVMITCTRLYANPAGGGESESFGKSAPSDQTGDTLWHGSLPLLALDEQGLILRSSKGASGLFLAKGLEEGSTTLWEALGEAGNDGPVREDILSALQSVMADGKNPAVIVPHAENLSLSEEVPVQWVLSRVEPGDLGVKGAAVLAIGLSGIEVRAPFESAPLVDSGTADHLAEALAPSAPLISSADQDEVARLMAELTASTEAVHVSQIRENRLRAVLDLAPCGLLVLDERARPIYHNAQVHALLGRGITEGQSVEDWIAEGSRDDVHREEVTRQWREGVWRKQLTVALTLATADELLKDIEMRPVSLPGGGLMVMLQDVTDSRRSEEMLRSTEAKFRTLVHENPQPVILTDRTGSVFDANPAAEALLGYTRAELRRMDMERWLEPASVKDRIAALREMVQHADRARVVPVVIQNRENNLVNANLRLAIVPDVQGEPMFTVQFIMPVALGAESGSIARASEPDHRPAPLMDLSHDGLATVAHTTTVQDLLMTDVHGKIIIWSAEAEEQFGYTAAQLVGKGLHQLFRPSDATGFYAELASLATAEGAPVEWTYYHGEEGRTQGRFIVNAQPEGGFAIDLQNVLEVTVHVAPRATGEDSEMDSFMADEEEDEQEVAKSAIPTPEALNREKLLLGETHHRVKNHLQIITSMLNLQISTLHNEEARDALRSSQNRVRSIAALHQHLYQVSTGESGEFAAFAKELVRHLRECFEVSEQRVRLEFHLPEKEVPEEWLMPLALSLNEMVSNAFKHAYADDGEGDMRVELKWDDEQGQLSVTDDGLGLPEGFDDQHPSGMGLKILRVFAGQLGGEIKVSGVPGEGAEFRLCFPVGVNQI